jgi:hypothetical protein
MTLLCKPLLASAFAALSMLAVDASAATVRVTCEVRPSRSKISIDGKGLVAGTYTTVAVSGANMASHPPVNTVGDEIETDFDSNPRDIAQGAAPIAANFISGGQVTGKIVDAMGNTVISDTVACRIRRR